MNSQPPKQRTARARAGFTLLEILITITIIGILTAVVFGALHSARQSAKAAKTKSIITRLHYVIMAKYDSYRTRRVSMNLVKYINNNSTYYPLPASGVRNWRQDLARARVNAIRDLIRMEMPDRWSDVLYDPLVLSSRPAVSRRYLNVYSRSAADAATKEKWGAAELLYMIVMNIPEAAEQFYASEIGDIDADGLPEFHDGWDRPIRFIRWPSGFIPANDADTNLQTDVIYNPVDPTTQPDPFDPQGVMVTLFGEASFPLYPLIYSAGPDGIFDINIGKEGEPGPNDAPRPGEEYTYRYRRDDKGNLDPFKADPNLNFVGAPKDAKTPLGEPKNDEPDHYDNIHNHRLEMR